MFSIWTTIEECLNPPIVWDGRRGWHTTEPFSAPEAFPFPEGIGPVECVNVEHEEVLLVPALAPDARRSTFKYALGADFIDKLKTLHALGLDRTDTVSVKGVEVAPRDVVAAITPDPISLGDKLRRPGGRRAPGCIGTKDGKPREVFLYQMADAEETWREYGLQVVGWQTGFNPVIAMELLAEGAWTGRRGAGTRRRSTPIRTSRCSTATASTTPWSRWSRGRTARPERGYSTGVMRSMVASSRARISRSSRSVSLAHPGSSSGAGGIGCWSARSWNG